MVALHAISSALLTSIEESAAAAVQSAGSYDRYPALTTISVEDTEQGHLRGGIDNNGVPCEVVGASPAPRLLQRHCTFVLSGMAQKSRIGTEASPAPLGARWSVLLPECTD